jgi:hypothetical protein
VCKNRPRFWEKDLSTCGAKTGLCNVTTVVQYLY